MQKFLFFVALVLIVGCKSAYESTLSSRDIAKKEALAFELYEKGDFYKASELFKSLIQDKKNGEDIEAMFFYYALCDYHLGDYGLAAYEFERLVQKFPRGECVEDAQFYIGLSNYHKSPPYFLDQDYTHRAIESFQLFLDKFPNSAKQEEVNLFVDKLNSKLELKMYKQAKLFYHMEEYKSSTVFLGNLLSEFPDSKYAEEVNFLIADSHYKLASKSIEDKKIERYNKAVKAANYFNSKYKESDYSLKIGEIKEKSKEEVVRLKKELPDYYHRVGRYDKAIGLYETLLRRAKKMEDQQEFAKKLFQTYHSKAQKAPTQYKVEYYEDLLKYYNELSAPNKDYIDNKIGKEVASAKLGYGSYRSSAAYQLYKEGKYSFSVKEYKKLLADSGLINSSKDWYFFYLANYRYAAGLEALDRKVVLDSLSGIAPQTRVVLEKSPSSYNQKFEKLIGKVKKDLTMFPVGLIREPYQNGKYKLAIGRAQNLLRTKITKKDEEEIVYLLIAASVKHAKKGKRFERFERFNGSQEFYKQHIGRVESVDYKTKLSKLNKKIEKGLFKYQIKEE